MLENCSILLNGLPIAGTDQKLNVSIKPESIDDKKMLGALTDKEIILMTQPNGLQRSFRVIERSLIAKYSLEEVK